MMTPKKYFLFFVSIVIVQSFNCDKIIDSEDEISTEMKISNEVFNHGEILNGEFIIHNNSNETRIFHFSSSCQFGYRVKGGDVDLYRTDGCRMNQSKFEIMAGQSKVFEFEYSLKDFDGEYLPSGVYKIHGFLYDMDYNENRSFQIK